MVVTTQNPRTFVKKIDFVTTVGFLDGGDARAGLSGDGPTRIVTDLGILAPDPQTHELMMTHLHQGVTREHAREATGWDIRFSDDLAETEPPKDSELAVLRDLLQRTETAHKGE